MANGPACASSGLAVSTSPTETAPASDEDAPLWESTTMTTGRDEHFRSAPSSRGSTPWALCLSATFRVTRSGRADPCTARRRCASSDSAAPTLSPRTTGCFSVRSHAQPPSSPTGGGDPRRVVLKVQNRDWRLACLRCGTRSLVPARRAELGGLEHTEHWSRRRATANSLRAHVIPRGTRTPCRVVL